ncbi:MAG TPA: hypothetical protein VL588_09175 [Bdellovibrionota bacterium]|jgi:ElaB/YqjD/DUF883 family membrane-anchored ribosome-binding protein|nr:hypothetical protein [Bdellovibrionota bacterium]
MENAKQLEPKNQSINEALRVLSDAARTSSEEIKSLLDTDFQRLKRAIITSDTGEAIVRLKDRVSNSTDKVVRSVDRSAHENPWVFVGAAAAAAAILALMVGRKSA